MKRFEPLFLILAIAVLLRSIAVNKIDGDFLLYWGAFQVFMNGGNPYSPSEVGTLINDTTINHTIWNPPLIFFYLSWILICPFKIARIILSSISIVAVFFIPLLITKCEKLKLKNHSLLILVFSLFAPTAYTFLTSQLSLFCTLTAVFTYYLIKEKNYNFIAGFLLPILLIKAHIFGFYLSYILLLAILEKRYRIILGGISSFLIALLFVLFINPEAIFYQINTLEGAKVWDTVGLSQFFSIFYNYRFHIYVVLNIIFIISTLITKRIPNLYVILCVSMLLIPYGFLFDYCLLLPVLTVASLKLDINKEVSKICLTAMIITNGILYLKPIHSISAAIFTLALLILTISQVKKVPSSHQ